MPFTSWRTDSQQLFSCNGRWIDTDLLTKVGENRQARPRACAFPQDVSHGGHGEGRPHRPSRYQSRQHAHLLSVQDPLQQTPTGEGVLQGMKDI